MKRRKLLRVREVGGEGCERMAGGADGHYGTVLDVQAGSMLDGRSKHGHSDFAARSVERM